VISQVMAFCDGVVGVLAALLPARHWHRFPRLPIARMMLLSAILTAGVGALAGGVGFLSYSAHAADHANRAMLEVANRQALAEPGHEPDITTATTAVVSAFSVVAFTFFTPLGLLCLYLVASGFIRAAANVAGETRGDPLLSGIDAIATRSSRSWRRRSEGRDRERREGAEVPDRLYPGAWAGLPEFDYVVVAARRKDDWTRGTFVLTSERWYTLGEPFELELPSGLRTVYPLRAHTTPEVLRRGVAYELPPLEPAKKPRA
jgi:hypothetical protein